jgi:hypothetical protein
MFLQLETLSGLNKKPRNYGELGIPIKDVAGKSPDMRLVAAYGGAGVAPYGGQVAA